MSKRNRKDRFFYQAKKDGYAARSVFKLQSADRKFGLIRRKDTVLDLGCHPGSWLQYCRERVGEKGQVVGVDRRTLHALPEGCRFIEGDVLSMDLVDILSHEQLRFDVVLSDLAPDTTGDRFVDGVRSYELSKRALEIARAVLKPQGRFFCKIFQGTEFPLFLKEVRRSFTTTRVFKPPSSRKESREVFVFGKSKTV